MINIPESVWNLMRTEVGPEFSDIFPRFVRGMIDRMVMSAFKYGPVTPDLPKTRDMMATIKLRLQKYEDTHNTEFLMDVANFCAMEFTFPSFSDATFKATDSEASPGIVNPDGSVTHQGPEKLLQRSKDRREMKAFWK